LHYDLTGTDVYIRLQLSAAVCEEHAAAAAGARAVQEVARSEAG